MPETELTAGQFSSLADAATPPILIPMFGAAAVAWLLFAAGIVAGGVWAVQRLSGRPASGAGSWALRALGRAACAAAAFCGLAWSASGLDGAAGLFALSYVLVFAFVGVSLLWAASRRRMPSQGTAVSHEQADTGSNSPA